MKKIVAIEVSRDAIRAAEILAPLSKNPSVSKIGEVEIPPGVAGESQVYEVDNFVESLERLWEEYKFTTRSVVLVVSGRRFIVRPHETFHTSMKDLKGVLRYEAASVIPESMQNPIIDFYPISNTETQNGEKTNGLVIATPVEPIETLVGALVKAKLQVEFVDFAPMSIARFIKNNVSSEDYGEGYALANIRELSTDILIAKGDTPHMIRVAAAGLLPPQKKLGRHVKQETNSFVDTDGSIYTPVEVLAREIKVTINSQIEDLGIKIDTLYLTGPRSDEETAAELKRLLDINVVSLTSDSAKHKDELDSDILSSDFVAVCAGMRGKK